MKVFVAFGYNERDRWIPEMVFPILEAFGIEVVTGEEMPGNIISVEVIKRIKNSDALIGFLTRRDDLDNENYSTHPWVINEVALALGADCKVIEVREDGVINLLPLTQDRQYLFYNEAQRDKFLVELVKAISQWGTVGIKLLPGEFCEKVKPLIRQQEKIVCEYCFSIGNWSSEWYTGRLLNEPAGVVIYVNTSDLPRRRENVLIQVHVRDPSSGESWLSDTEKLEQRIVTMQLGVLKK
jgi:hypothetical protein